MIFLDFKDNTKNCYEIVMKMIQQYDSNIKFTISSFDHK